MGFQCQWDSNVLSHVFWSLYKQLIIIPHCFFEILVECIGSIQVELATVHPGSVPAGPRRARGGMGSVWRARAGPRSPRSPRARGARRARREPAESPCKSWLSANASPCQSLPSALCKHLCDWSWEELARVEKVRRVQMG